MKDLERPLILPLGDTAATIRFGDEVDATLAKHVQSLARRIRSAGLPYVREVVVGYAALTVWYDALHTDYAVTAAALDSILLDPTPLPASDNLPRDHVIPVTYDGPDLGEVANRTGLTIRDVIARHSDRWYEVYLIGFVPGWGYLGDLDPRLVLPRRATPRTHVPAGSVAIAGAQTGVYSLTTPGGWYLLGRTSVRMFDPLADRPALLAPGDRVRFEPIGESANERQPSNP